MGVSPAHCPNTSPSFKRAAEVLKGSVLTQFSGAPRLWVRHKDTGWAIERGTYRWGVPGGSKGTVFGAGEGQQGFYLGREGKLYKGQAFELGFAGRVGVS